MLLLNLHFNLFTRYYQDQILRESYNPAYGARPMRRFVDKYIATEVSRLIIAGRLSDNQDVLVEATVSGATLPSSVGRFTFIVTDKPAL